MRLVPLWNSLSRIWGTLPEEDSIGIPPTNTHFALMIFFRALDSKARHNFLFAGLCQLRPRIEMVCPGKSI
jgi:hypothetical protein